MSYQWKPIDDLPSDYDSLADEQAQSVITLWRDRASRLRSTKAYDEFLVKLRRQWAIETGVLERLYSISEGATRTLIEKGFDAALLSHDDSDRPAREVIAMIRDHSRVIDGLYDVVAGSQALSMSYIRQLHQVITAHQVSYTAVDALGNVGEREMQRGVWKTHPNNVELADGSTFEFCPPEQVAPEMERLLALHLEHLAAGVPTEVEAAWLHHRFTLIHPFVDGNGRVARALATLVFLRDGWFPLVVTRNEKSTYVEALRQADAGDLSPLVRLFGDLQRRAVREALSLSEEVEREATAIDSILSNVTDRFAARRRQQAEAYQRAVETSVALAAMTHDRFGEVAQKITAVLKAESREYYAVASFASHGDHRAAFNRWQIVRTAKQLGYYANLETYPSWVELKIEAKSWVGILVAFHGIGHEWLGLMGSVAIAYRKAPADDGRLEVVDLKPLCSTPFEIAYSEDPVAVEQRYRKWLEDCLILGLDFWQQNV